MPDEPKPEAEELTTREAAEKLDQVRGTSEANIVTYTAGADLADNMTMTLDQGAKALTDAREADQAQAEIDDTAKIKKEVDELRGTKEEAKPALEPEPDIEKTLNHPRVKAALEQHIQETEAVKQNYSKAVDVANTFAQAAFIENFPEIAALPLAQWEGALAAMSQQEPERFAKAMGTLNRVAQLQAAQQQQQQEKAHAARQQFQEYAKAENARFAELTKGESPATMRAVEAHIPQMLAESGADVRQFLEAVSNQSTFPRATAEALLVKAAKYDLLMKATKPAPGRAALPPVQRPGITRSANAAERSSANLGALNSKFNQSGNIKDAVALLNAKRAKG